MKVFKKIIAVLFALCMSFGAVACDDKGDNSNNSASDIENIQKNEETHYLKFIENGVEILRIVVIKGETYEDLLPYFPTLTQEEGFIKYWDGDYRYTDYTSDNQFKVYDENDLEIEINSYAEKAN